MNKKSVLAKFLNIKESDIKELEDDLYYVDYEVYSVLTKEEFKSLCEIKKVLLESGLYNVDFINENFNVDRFIEDYMEIIYDYVLNNIGLYLTDVEKKDLVNSFIEEVYELSGDLLSKDEIDISVIVDLDLVDFDYIDLAVDRFIESLKRDVVENLCNLDLFYEEFCLYIDFNNLDIGDYSFIDELDDYIIFTEVMNG